jgi:anti-sigma regulatory factor (Ser/Thr protein kinase)
VAHVDEKRHFPAETGTVVSVRHFVRGALESLDPDTVEDGVLLVSEVATNVVEHARTVYEVRVIQEGDWARIEVADGSGVLPAVRDLADDADRGRGLMLLQRLSAAWGVEERPSGKCVWFEMVGVVGGGSPRGPGSSRPG